MDDMRKAQIDDRSDREYLASENAAIVTMAVLLFAKVYS
jgi:hypothetical protein